jgi:hypothetical protein
VTLTFVDNVSGHSSLGTVTTDGDGAFNAQVTIPAAATQGKQKITAKARLSGQTAKRSFTVT